MSHYAFGLVAVASIVALLLSLKPPATARSLRQLLWNSVLASLLPSICGSLFVVVIAIRHFYDGSLHQLPYALLLGVLAFLVSALLFMPLGAFAGLVLYIAYRHGQRGRRFSSNSQS